MCLPECPLPETRWSAWWPLERRGASRCPTRSRLKCVGSHRVAPGTFLRAERGAVWGRVTGPATSCWSGRLPSTSRTRRSSRFVKSVTNQGGGGRANPFVKVDEKSYVDEGGNLRIRVTF